MTTTDINTTKLAVGHGVTLQDFHIPLDDAYTVTLSATLQDAVDIMNLHEIDQVPVVDADYDGAMVVTRRGVALVPPTDRSATPVAVALAEHSNDPNQRVPASTPLTEAADCLIDYDWVLTTDEDGRPVGLATVGDALRAALDS